MQATSPSNVIVPHLYENGFGRRTTKLTNAVDNCYVSCFNERCLLFAINNISFLQPRRPFVDGFLIVYQAGICCVYVVFVAANVKEMVDNLGYVMDVKIHMVILLLPVMLLMCVRNLKLLAPLSLFSNVITFVGRL